MSGELPAYDWSGSVQRKTLLHGSPSWHGLLPALLAVRHCFALAFSADNFASSAVLLPFLLFLLSSPNKKPLFLLANAAEGNLAQRRTISVLLCHSLCNFHNRIHPIQINQIKNKSYHDGRCSCFQQRWFPDVVLFICRICIVRL